MSVLKIILALSVLTVGAPSRAMCLEKSTIPCSGKEASVGGAWKGESAEVLFERDEIIIWNHGELSVAKILDRQPCSLQVRYQGLKSNWAFSLDHDTLQLKADEPLTLQHVAKTPAELDLSPPSFPSPSPVSADEAKTVEMELVRRGALDQDTLKNPALKANWPEVKAENLRYLRELTRRLGWIDIRRFGKRSAAAAILIAKHGQDLLLMKAALPIVERDVKENGGVGEMFSVMYDEVQVTLGNKQKYGTQIAEDTQGHPLIMPLEAPSRWRATTWEA